MAKRVFVEDGEQSAPPPALPAQEAPVRPKVMRRPVQFSRGTPIAAMEPIAGAPLEKPSPAPHHAHGRAWQDDGVFGLALIATLAFVNLVLMLLVPHLPVASAPEEKATGLVLFGSSAMPQAVRKEDSNVTLYADPAAQERLTNEFDLQRTTPEQNELSVSPKDIPAPRARALDNSQQ